MTDLTEYFDRAPEERLDEEGWEEEEITEDPEAEDRAELERRGVVLDPEDRLGWYG